MNNINTIDKNNNSKPNGWRNLGYVLMLAGLLNANFPTYAQTNDYNSTFTEQVTPQANKLNGIKLPTVYQNKLDDFLANNTVMKDNDAKNYTLNFVKKEMETESNRGISKENQLLFIRHAIYKQITDNDLYDGQDGNQKTAEDFSNKAVNIRIRACGQKYRNGIITYMNEISAEARQQSAEARQQSADYDKRIAEARQQSAEAKQQSINELNKALDGVIDFYNSYQISPDPARLESFKPKVKELISRCKELNINYKEKLPKEVREFFNID